MSFDVTNMRGLFAFTEGAQADVARQACNEIDELRVKLAVAEKERADATAVIQRLVQKDEELQVLYTNEHCRAEAAEARAVKLRAALEQVNGAGSLYQAHGFSSEALAADSATEKGGEG